MKWGALVLMVTIAGCSHLPAKQGHGQEQADQATNSSTRDLLAQGQRQACSQADVENSVLSSIKPSFRPNDRYTQSDIDAGSGLVSYDISAITLSNLDKSVGSVSCDANFTIHDKEVGDKTFQISYLISPSVEDPKSIIVHTNAPSATEYPAYAVSNETDGAKFSRLKSAQQQETRAQGSEVTAPPSEGVASSPVTAGPNAPSPQPSNADQVDANSL